MSLIFRFLDVTVDDVEETRISVFSDGLFVGTAGVQHTGRISAGIRQLFVHPEYRKQGIGSAIVVTALSLAKASGCNSLGLSLQPDNRELFGAFYQKLGFIAAYQYDDGSAIISHQIS